MKKAKISAIRAREILDSKGRPMVEVDVWTTDGFMGRGASPCGTSVGRHEAIVLRDGGKRYGGLGVQRAVRNVTEVIAPALVGKCVVEQRMMDGLMVELDGTPDKSRLGANAIYSVSIAVARAAASCLGIPLHEYLGGGGTHYIPAPIFNMINGGSSGDVSVEFQEFLLIPAMAETYAEALQTGVEVFFQLERTIKRRFGQKSLHTGPSAGYAAPTNNPADVLEVLLEAAEEAGYGGMCKLGLDCAASHFYDREKNCYRFKGKETSRQEMMGFLKSLTGSYPLFLIEDPFHEDDFEGFAEITKGLNILIAGDDLFVTNQERLRKGVELGAANGIIMKPNMVGTLSEALDTAHFAKEHGYKIIASGRAGGMPDDPIPEIAVALNVPLAKLGAPRTGERTSKHNCLIRIEEELGKFGRYSGPEILK